jgi:hypothetical protein
VAELSTQGPLFVVHEPSDAAALRALAAEWHAADIAIHPLSVQDMATPHPQTLEGIAARLVTAIVSRDGRKAVSWPMKWRPNWSAGTKPWSLSG